MPWSKEALNALYWKECQQKWKIFNALIKEAHLNKQFTYEIWERKTAECRAYRIVSKHTIGLKANENTYWEQGSAKYVMKNK